MMSETKEDQLDSCQNSFEEKHLQEYLDHAAKILGISSPNYCIKSGSKVGDNYIGIIYRIFIEGKKSGLPVKTQVIIKVPPQDEAVRLMLHVRYFFPREHLFYLEIVPLFKDFLTAKNKRLENLPECYFSSDVEKKEVICVEDLQIKGFVLRDRIKQLDFAHVSLALRALGRLHAISFALRDQRPEIFSSKIATLKEILYRLEVITDSAFIENFKECGDLVNTPRNVFVVDWRVGACSETVKYLNFQSYSSAAANVKEVGRYVARWVRILVDDYTVLLKDVWLIGHSLGAHVAGFAGKTIGANGVEKVGRITGLDPAGPLFRGIDAAERIDKTDAVFVEIVHTSRLLGLQEPVGHVDLYYNGGEFQMSCLFNKPGCSHDRAVDYYLEGIRNPSCQFVAKAWPLTGRCRGTRTTCPGSYTIAGPLATAQSARGKFYVQTNVGQPYCTGESPSLEPIADIPEDHDPLDENIFDIEF